MDYNLSRYEKETVVTFNEDEISKTYIFPKRYFKVRKPSWREGKKPSFFETGGKEDGQNMADP